LLFSRYVSRIGPKRFTLGPAVGDFNFTGQQGKKLGAKGKTRRRERKWGPPAFMPARKSFPLHQDYGRGETSLVGNTTTAGPGLIFPRLSQLGLLGRWLVPTINIFPGRKICQVMFMGTRRIFCFYGADTEGKNWPLGPPKRASGQRFREADVLAGTGGRCCDHRFFCPCQVGGVEKTKPGVQVSCAAAGSFTRPFARSAETSGSLTQWERGLRISKKQEMLCRGLRPPPPFAIFRA